MAQLQELRNVSASIEQARRGFNTSLNTLLNAACRKNPRDETLLDIKAIVQSVQAVNNTLIIEQAGPYVWKYREQISKHDEEFFLVNNFQEDIAARKAAGKLAAGGRDFSENEIATIMNSIKSIYKSLTPPERDTIWRHVQDLLRNYAQYVRSEQRQVELRREISRMNK